MDNYMAVVTVNIRVDVFSENYEEEDVAGAVMDFVHDKLQEFVPLHDMDVVEVDLSEVTRDSNPPSDFKDEYFQERNVTIMVDTGTCEQLTEAPSELA